MNRSRADQIKQRPSELEVEHGFQYFKEYCVGIKYSLVLEEKMKERLNLVPS